MFTRKDFINVTVKPFVVYSGIIILLITLAEHNVGILNGDVSLGLFVSWMVYTVILIFCISILE